MSTYFSYLFTFFLPCGCASLEVPAQSFLFPAFSFCSDFLVPSFRATLRGWKKKVLLKRSRGCKKEWGRERRKRVTVNSVFSGRERTSQGQSLLTVAAKKKEQVTWQMHFLLLLMTRFVVTGAANEIDLPARYVQQMEVFLSFPHSWPRTSKSQSVIRKRRRRGRRERGLKKSVKVKEKVMDFFSSSFKFKFCRCSFANWMQRDEVNVNAQWSYNAQKDPTTRKADNAQSWWVEEVQIAKILFHKF